MGNKLRIFIASDSTAQTYKESEKPRAGWGEMLSKYFSPEIEVINRAIGGRSSRSFIEQGRLARIEEEIKEGDYLFIQFGHNDADLAKPERYVSVEDFPKYIQQYIDCAKNKGAYPILLTPVARRDYNSETHLFNISFPQYRNKVIELAKETNTALIDLGLKSVEILNQIGLEDSKKLFLHFEANTYENIPEKMEDNTHFQVTGAVTIAKLIAEEIKNLDIKLSDQVII